VPGSQKALHAPQVHGQSVHAGVRPDVQLKPVGGAPGGLPTCPLAAAAPVTAARLDGEQLPALLLFRREVQAGELFERRAPVELPRAAAAEAAAEQRLPPAPEKGLRILGSGLQRRR